MRINKGNTESTAGYGIRPKNSHQQVEIEIKERKASPFMCVCNSKIDWYKNPG